MIHKPPHEDGVIQCGSVYAGPCSCLPGVHINLERKPGDLAATTILSLDECEGLIKQIRASARAVRQSSAPFKQRGTP